jgi:hypothetical protein
MQSFENLFLTMLDNMHEAYEAYQAGNDEYAFVMEAHDIIDYYEEQRMKMYRDKLA